MQLCFAEGETEMACCLTCRAASHPLLPLQLSACQQKMEELQQAQRQAAQHAAEMSEKQQKLEAARTEARKAAEALAAVQKQVPLLLSCRALCGVMVHMTTAHQLHATSLGCVLAHT
jgi:hypothetical protein